MKRFCIAYISYYDNEIVMHTLIASDELSALKKCLRDTFDVNVDELSSVEEIKQFAFNCDFMVGVLEVC